MRLGYKANILYVTILTQNENVMLIDRQSKTRQNSIFFVELNLLGMFMLFKRTGILGQN